MASKEHHGMEKKINKTRRKKNSRRKFVGGKHLENCSNFFKENFVY